MQTLPKHMKIIVTREESAYIREALNQCGWNKTKAAKLLGISYRSIQYKINEYDLNPEYEETEND